MSPRALRVMLAYVAVLAASTLAFYALTGYGGGAIQCLGVILLLVSIVLAMRVR
jgi:hypothetical protein